MQASDIAAILSAYARLVNSPRVDYYQVVDYVKKLGERRGDAALQRLAKNHIPELVQILNDLERQGQVGLMREGGMVSSIEVPSYFRDTLRKIYATMADSPSVPFPDRETLRMEVPPSTVLVTDVKQDFASLLAREGKLEKEIVRINFPEGIGHLLAPAEVVGAKLVELSVAKLSLYLRDPRNQGYVSSKLRSVLAGAEIALTNMLNDVVARPGKAVQTLFEPGDFSLKFWTHFASLVLQDLTKKKDKSRDDHGYCQASYVIGHYIVHQRGVQQREQERATDLKRMETMLKKPPYAFSLEEIFSLRDPKGIPFVKKHTRQFVIDFLQARVQSTDAGRLPPVVRLKGPGNREYFIPREFVAPLCMNKVHEAAEELRKQYMLLATEQTKNNERSGPIADDQRFLVDVRTRIQESYPLLHALLGPDLLYLAKEEVDPGSTAKAEVEACFSGPRKLKAVPQIMGLDRKKILKDARAVLPPWYTMPVLRHLFFLFRGIFSGSRRKPAQEVEQGDWVDELHEGAAAARTSEAESPPSGVKELARQGESATAAYRASMRALVKEFVGTEKRIDASLEELAEKWNPLFDDEAKRNLVADVDSYIRDFVRSLRKGFRVKPPDAGRIRKLAEELSQKQALAQIKKKDYLKKYIEIYMIRLLVRR